MLQATQEGIREVYQQDTHNILNRATVHHTAQVRPHRRHHYHLNQSNYDFITQKRRTQSRTYPRLPVPLTLHPHSPSPTSHPSPSPQTAPSHHNQHYCTLPSSPQHDCTRRAAHAVSGHYPTLDRVDGRYDQTGVWRLLLCCTCRTCAWRVGRMCCAVNDGGEDEPEGSRGQQRGWMRALRAFCWTCDTLCVWDE